jgi:3-hydroxybutyryl-CoA dehydrogenase
LLLLDNFHSYEDISDISSRLFLQPQGFLQLLFIDPSMEQKKLSDQKRWIIRGASNNFTIMNEDAPARLSVLDKKETPGGLLAHGDQKRLEMGIATAEDIDKACVYGAGHPMGPFRLMDLTGIDLTYIMSVEKFKETGDFADLPVPSVVEKYVHGCYGEKTGKGWYDYTKK